MSDRLDLLLDHVREAEPSDDAFVMGVMTRVNAEETRLTARLARRGLRRPMVMGVVAAVVVTGGAVAAVVGTKPVPETPATQRPAAIVEASDEPTSDAGPAPKRSAAGIAATDPAPTSSKVPTGEGYATDHTSFIVDATTGLLLQTETYTNAFTVEKAQRVTLTLENTGRHPITIDASEGCAMQVMAYAADDNQPDTALITDPSARFEWECAGSDSDPRGRVFGDTFLLAPGERKVADAFLTLPQEGTWKISGMCRCEYRQIKPTPVPKGNPIDELTRRALPSPLLPEQPDGKNLVAPPVGIRADQ